MTNTLRRIKASLLSKAQSEHVNLILQLADGVGYDKIGYRIWELERDIAAYSAELA